MFLFLFQISLVDIPTEDLKELIIKVNKLYDGRINYLFCYANVFSKEPHQ